MGTRRGTEWRFVLVGIHFHNGLAESRVKALKHTLEHKLQETIVRAKLTLNHAELCKLLSSASDAVNGQLTTPRTPSLGGTSSIEPSLDSETIKGHMGPDLYLSKLLQIWHKMWRKQAFSSLLPY